MNALAVNMRRLRSSLVGVLAACLCILVFAGCSAASRGARALERADRYFKAGEYDKAKIEYLNVLRLTRANRTAIKQLGIIWFEDGASLRAFPYLRAARDLDPNDLNIRMKFASTLLALGGADEARKQALAILQQFPSAGEPLLLLADSVRSKEEVEATEQQLRQMQLPESAALHLAFASLAMRKNEMVTADIELQRALALDPKSAVGHMSLANFYYLKKDMDRAGQEYKAAAELAPVRSIERLKYAEFQALNGAPSDAHMSLKELTQQAPDYFPAWLLLAQRAQREKKFDDSLSLLENILSRDSENIEARMLQAEALLAKGDGKKAVEVLEALEKTYQNVPGIEYHLGRAYLQNHDPARAILALQKAVAAKPDYAEAILLLAQLNLQTGNPQPVVEGMVELLKKRPDMTAAQSLLAEAYRLQGRLDDAAAVIREQIKALPQSSPAYFLLGLILRQQNKAEEARRAFEKTLELAPDNAVAVDQLVELDIASYQFEAAMQRVQGQLQKTPDSAALHLIEAKIYTAQHALDRAEAALLKARDLDPNSPAASELLISTYTAENKLPEAIKELQASLSKDPDKATALITLGEIYEKQKDWPKAREAYEKVLTKHPDVVVVLNNLACLYDDQFNEPEKAYELARKARELKSTDPRVADTFGWALFKKGDYQQALPLLQESSRTLVEDPVVQFHLGMASYMMNQPEMARAAFEQALKGTADFAGKDEAQRRLSLLGQDGVAAALTIEQLESMLKQQPADPVARLRLGEAYDKQKAFPKAAAEYERALQINPKLLPAVLKLAQLNGGPLQNSDKALEYAKKARALAPTDANVAGVLGSVAYRAGNFSWAYSLLQESARQLDHDPTVLHDYAWAAYIQGKGSEAREVMQRAVQAAPPASISEDAKLFLSMTALTVNSKDAAAAESEVQKALKADPGYVPALMVRAGIEKQRGESKAAISTYGEILQRFPDFAPAQKQLAAVYLEDPNGAGKAYELAMKARKTLADDPELALTLGEISYQRKEYPRALQLLQESARTNALDAKGLYYLGMSYAQAKQKPKAQEILEQALAAGLQEPFVSEAKKRSIN